MKCTMNSAIMVVMMTASAVGAASNESCTYYFDNGLDVYKAELSDSSVYSPEICRKRSGFSESVGVLFHDTRNRGIMLRCNECASGAQFFLVPDDGMSPPKQYAIRGVSIVSGNELCFPLDAQIVFSGVVKTSKDYRFLICDLVSGKTLYSEGLSPDRRLVWSWRCSENAVACYFTGPGLEGGIYVFSIIGDSVEIRRQEDSWASKRIECVLTKGDSTYYLVTEWEYSPVREYCMYRIGPKGEISVAWKTRGRIYQRDYEFGIIMIDSNDHLLRWVPGESEPSFLLDMYRFPYYEVRDTQGVDSVDVSPGCKYIVYSKLLDWNVKGSPIVTSFYNVMKDSFSQEVELEALSGPWSLSSINFGVFSCR